MLQLKMVAYPGPVRCSARKIRITIACATAFMAVLAGVYFLIDNYRAAGLVAIAVVVMLGAELARGASADHRTSVQPIVVGATVATMIGVAAFAVAVALVAVTAPS